MPFEAADEKTAMGALALPWRLLPEPSAITEPADLFHFVYLYGGFEESAVLAPVGDTGMRSRPPYPQPVLVHPVTGYHYYLQLTADGAFDEPVLTTDPADNPVRLRLVSGSRLTAWTLRLSADLPPAITAVPCPVPMAQYTQLSIWDWRGREYDLTIDDSGGIALTGIGRDWPMLPTGGVPTSAPALMRLPGTSGQHWLWTVNDGGIWFVSTAPEEPVVHLRSFSLWTTDNAIPFTITIDDATGILTVTDAAADTPKRFEVVLVSESGTPWLLKGKHVGGDVILELSDELQRAIDSGDEWPLVIGGRGQTLYVADDRYPPPLPGIPKRGRRKKV